MNKHTFVKGIGVLGIVAALPMLTPLTAFASTSSFQTQYQNNNTQETSLLQTARSVPVSDAEQTTLSNAVQTLDAQISTLYGVEQSLASNPAASSTSSINSINQQIAALKQKRQTLLKQVSQYWGNFASHRNDKHDTKNTLAQLLQQWRNGSSQLQQLDQQIATLQSQLSKLRHPSNNDGLTALQNSILQLQAVAIEYTKEWIALNNSGQTTSVTTPTQLHASNVTSTGWTMNWQTVPNATSYNVYVNGTRVATNVTGTSYTFQNETPGTTYQVTISAVNSSNVESAQSSAVTVTTPMQISADQITSSGWTLHWSAAPGASAYDIYVNGYRAVTNASGTSYTFTGQNPGTRYTVRVVAVNSSNAEIAQSSTYTVTTQK